MLCSLALAGNSEVPEQDKSIGLSKAGGIEFVIQTSLLLPGT